MQKKANPQQHAESIKKYQRALQKRLLPAADKTPQINIREIIVKQAGQYPLSVGEFHHPTPSNQATETTAEVMNRIFMQIQKLAEYAKDIHLNNNFMNPTKWKSLATLHEMAIKKTTHISTVVQELVDNNDLAIMKPENKNEITRLVTHEFYFYPRKDNGPLSEQQFNELLEKIEDYAKNLPENLHLTLATFPLKNTANEVYNIGAYIQCGAIPRFDIFSKAISSPIDAEYPGTTLHYFTGDRAKSIAIEQINNIIQNFPSDTILPQKLASQLLEILIANPPENASPIYLMYTALKDKLKLVVNEKSLILAQPYLTDILCGLEFRCYFSTLTMEENIIENKVLQALNTFSPDPFALTYAPIGGNITCHTAGGNIFKTVIDICMDHIYAIALRNIIREFNTSSRTGSHTLITQVSHIITSNSVESKESSLLAKNQSFTQADPLRSGIKFFSGQQPPQPTTSTLEAHFGGPMDILVCEPLPIQPYYFTYLQDQLDKHNQFIIELEALRLFRAQNPWMADTVNQMINDAIHRELLYRMNAVPAGALSNNIITIRNLATISLNALSYLKEQPDVRREKTIAYFEDLLETYKNLATADEKQFLFIFSMGRDLLLKDTLDASLLLTTTEKNQEKSEEKNTRHRRGPSLSPDDSD